MVVVVAAASSSIRGTSGRALVELIDSGRSLNCIGRTASRPFNGIQVLVQYEGEAMMCMLASCQVLTVDRVVY